MSEEEPDFSVRDLLTEIMGKHQCDIGTVIPNETGVYTTGELSEMTGIGVKSIRRDLHEMEELGLVAEVKKRKRFLGGTIGAVAAYKFIDKESE